jgi:hypothetical protein
MKLRFVLGVVILLVGYVVLRPSLKPIGGGWAIGQSHFGSAESLVRVRDHGLFRRTTVSTGVTKHKFFKPDCVIYLATSSYDGNMYLAVCGDRTPVAVGEKYFTITPLGLEYLLRHDTFEGYEQTTERHIPLGRILNAAKRARPFSSSNVPRAGSVKPMEITYAHYPVAWTAWNQAGHTAIHDAVSNGCEEFLGDMLEKGVWPDEPDDKGITPMMLAPIMRADDDRAHSLVYRLLNAGANVDAQSNTGMTPLMFAKRAGAMGLYNLFLEWGADTTLTNSAGQKVTQMKPVEGYDPLSRNDSTSVDRCPEPSR